MAVYDLIHNIKQEYKSLRSFGEPASGSDVAKAYSDLDHKKPNNRPNYNYRDPYSLKSHKKDWRDIKL